MTARDRKRKRAEERFAQTAVPVAFALGQSQKIVYGANSRMATAFWEAGLPMWACNK